MNRIHLLTSSGLVLLAAALMSLAGCGGGADCGDGTIEVDGECVLDGDSTGAQCESGQIVVNGSCEDASTVCGDNTTYDADANRCVADGTDPNTGEGLSCGTNTSEVNGECVADDPVQCDTNTQELDAQTNTCVTTDAVCGEGTAYSTASDSCLPTDEVCADGTDFNDDTRLCMADGVNCQPGDVVLGGYCVAPVEELAASAEFIADGNTDPTFGGTPVELEVADIGDQSVFAGTIDGPSDLDGDGMLDQHIDVFQFTAEAGEWFEISVRANGIPSPAFAVATWDEDSEDFEVTRISSLGTTRDKMRQFIAPEAGDYYILVVPELFVAGTLQDESWLSGGDDWGYVGTFELLETPTPTAHDFEANNLAGTLGRLDDNFFAVEDLQEGDTFRFNWEVVPSSAMPVLTVWASPTELIEEWYGTGGEITVPEGGTFYIVADWNAANGYDLNYELSGVAATDLEPGDVFERSLTVGRIDVLEVRQTNTGDAPVEFWLTDSEDNIVIEPTTLTSDWLVSDLIRYIGIEAGEYTLWFENTSEVTIEQFSSSVQLMGVTEVTDFDATYSGEGLEDWIWGERDYYLVNFEEDVTFTAFATMTGFEATPEAPDNPWMQLGIYGLNNEYLAQSLHGMGPITFASNLEAGTYILRVGTYSAGNWGTFDYDLDLSFEVQENFFAPGEVLEFTIDGSEGNILEVTQDNIDGSDVTVTLTDASGEVVAEDTLPTWDLFRFMDLEDQETYTLWVENSSALGLVDLEVDINTISLIDADASFTADEDEVVRLTQDNADDATLFLVVADSDGEIVDYQSTSITDTFSFTAPADDSYSVWYFQSGVANDEQGVDDLVITIEQYQLFEVAIWTASAGQVIEAWQTNDNGDAATIIVQDTDSGDFLLEEEVADSELVRYVGLPGGDFTLWVQGFFADENSFDLETNLITPVNTEVDFNAEEGEQISVVQTNEEDELGVYLMIVDELNMIVDYGWVASGEGLTFTAPATLDYYVWYFQPELEDSEQVIDDLEITVVEYLLEEVFGINDTLRGDVLEFTVDNFLGYDVAIQISENATGEIIATYDANDGELIRHHGLPADGDYTVWYGTFEAEADFDEINLDDFTVISPMLIEDFDATIEATGEENHFAEQNYYLVHLEETTTYDIFVDNSMGSTAGGVRLFIYEEDQELYRMDPELWDSTLSASVEFTFEADTAYVLRLGNDWFSGPSLYECAMTFTLVE